MSFSFAPRLLLAAFLLAGPSLWSATPAQARLITDATGAKTELAKRPKRIVTLAPALGELAADILGTDLTPIVGVSEYTDYPVALKKVPEVGSYVRFNIEKVVALKPDLVLATLDGNSKDQIQHLRELKIPVVIISSMTLKDVSESIKLVANALGLPTQGKALSEKLEQGLADARARAQSRRARDIPLPRVVLEVGDDPLVVVGKGTFIHEVIETVGAENIFAGSPVHYPRPSLEQVMSVDPDLILLITMGDDPNYTKRLAGRWDRFPKLKAVAKHRVKIIDGNLIARPSLRLLQGLPMLEEAIYGQK